VSVVIDASVAVKWVLSEAGSESADSLLDDELIAPVFWLVEAANALWRRARLGQIEIEEAQARLAELEVAPVASLGIGPYLSPALSIALELGQPIYDCLYLAVALAHGTHVVTADRRFAAATLSAHPGRVRLLGAV
jgi:predicted nucleic acid-binding protein